MRKRLLYFGALMFLAGMASAFMSLLSLSSISAAGTSPEAGRLSLNSGATGYVAMPLNQSGVLLFSYNSSVGTDFCLANQTAFAAVDGAGGAGLIGAATALEGKGVYAIYENSTGEFFPYANTSSAAVVYSANAPAFPEGTYYAVFGNAGNRTATIVTSYLAIPASKLSSVTLSTMAYGGLSILLLGAGIIIALASLFMKEKGAAGRAARLDEEIEKEYDLMENKNGNGAGGGAKRRKAGRARKVKPAKRRR